MNTLSFYCKPGSAPLHTHFGASSHCLHTLLNSTLCGWIVTSTQHVDLGTLKAIGSLQRLSCN